VASLLGATVGNGVERYVIESYPFGAHFTVRVAQTFHWIWVHRACEEAALETCL